jgi:PAS domain S-box-containing protein
MFTRPGTAYQPQPILTRSLLFGVSLMIALIVVTAVVTQNGNADQRRSTARLLKTQDVVGHLETLRSLIAPQTSDLDAGVARAVEVQLGALRGLAQDNPARAGRLQQVGAALQERLEPGAFDGRATSGVRASIVAWRDAEDALLTKQALESESSFQRASRLNVATGVLALLALGTLVFLVDRNLRMRQAAEVEVTHQRETLRVTLASIGDGVITVDLAGRVTFINGEAEALTGWRAEEAAGRPLEDVFRVVHELTRQPVANSASRAIREGVVAHLAHETVLIGRHGAERPIGDIAAPIRDPDGAVAGVVLVFRDITAERAAIGLLRKLASELTAADAHKDEFLAMLAHEIRNPLAAIRSSAALLSQGDGGPRSSTAAQGVISRQTDHLSRLVEDLLDVSRISRGKLSLRRSRIDLRQALGPAIEACRPILESKQQTFDVDIPGQPLYVDGDSTRITQAVGNVLANASKFTPSGGRIQLSVAGANGEVAVSVRDNGIGLASEHLPNLFELFSQVDAGAQGGTTGLGIGLHLVKKLTEMHGGRVEMRSEGIGQGSELILHFPLAAIEDARPVPTYDDAGVTFAGLTATASPAYSTLAPAPQERARKILVVDDNVDSTASLVLLLKRKGYEPQVARDGLEAVETALATLPEVVLLDIGLPKLDGYEAARRIRRSPEGRKMRLIALTGWGREEDRVAARNAGFDDHLVKPIDPNHLLELLAQPATDGVSTYSAEGVAC